MKTTYASPADMPAEDAARPAILVWDAPVRVFHWLMVLSFAGAYLTAESERWRLLHVTLGYTMAGLVVFRIVWGLLGSRYAKFSSFVRGPAAVARYVRSLFNGQPEHHVGHNPAGAHAQSADGVAVPGDGDAETGDRPGAALRHVVGDAMLAVADRGGGADRRAELALT